MSARTCAPRLDSCRARSGSTERVRADFPTSIPTTSRRVPQRSLADPGRSASWSSARIWRWLTPYERERVERFGLYLNLLERPGRPSSATGARRWAPRG
jgi:hypothetical protein